MISLDAIARACGGEVTGGQARVPGPGHSPKDRSLSIGLTEDGQDIVVHSFAGDDALAAKDYVRERAGLPTWGAKTHADTDAIALTCIRRTRQHPDGDFCRTDNANAVGEVDATACTMPVPDKVRPAPTHHPGLGEPTTVWTYRDATGGLLGYVYRFDPAGGRKQFSPLSLWREGTAWRWRWKAWPKRRPLYGLDHLAARPNASVVVCEGEKATDAAQVVFPSSVALTSPGGAQAAGSADWSPLVGRAVMIWPDADAPGAVYASQVERELAAIGAGPVTIVDAMRIAAALPSGETRDPPAGWDAADALAEGWQPTALAALVIAYLELAEPAPSFVSFGPFRMNRDGLTVAKTKGKGEDSETEAVWISAAFEVIGRARDPSGTGWARWLRWRDPDGRRHEYAVPDSALHGDAGALAGELATRGLAVARPARGHLLDYLNRVSVGARVTTVARTGWHLIGETKVFVLPDEVIGQPPGETVVLSGGTNALYSRRGTLDDWRNGVGRLAGGHGRLVLTIATALAGPLLDLTDGEGGGINLYGHSSKGKTTTLRAAASVWGRGGTDPGFVRSWRATANAQEATAAVVSDTLLCLDEVGVAEGRDAAAAVYQLASGVGKGRSARDGSIRAPMTWRVFVLSTGEVPMAAKIAEDRQRRAYAGQGVRLLDVPADAGRGFGVFDGPGPDGDPATFAEGIKRAALKHYGTAGPAFVRALAAAGMDEARQMVADLVEAFVAEHAPPEADGQVRRAAYRLGTIAAAGELAIGFGIAPWSEGEAEAAAARALTDWIASRGGQGAAETREAVAQVRRFFEAHGDSRFEVLDDGDARPVQNRVGWRRGQGDDRTWFVPPEMWKAEICQGLDPVGTARLLIDLGVLRPDAQGKSSRSERIRGSTLRVHAITAAILEGGQHAR